MFVEEIHINATEGYWLGDPTTYEAWTEDVGKLFRRLQREYGRCVSKVYIDVAYPHIGCKKAHQVGWVFQKRRQYSDIEDTYLHEVWVTLLVEPDTVIKQRHLLYLDKGQRIV